MTSSEPNRLLTTKSSFTMQILGNHSDVAFDQSVSAAAPIQDWLSSLCLITLGIVPGLYIPYGRDALPDIPNKTIPDRHDLQTGKGYTTSDKFSKFIRQL